MLTDPQFLFFTSKCVKLVKIPYKGINVTLTLRLTILRGWPFFDCPNQIGFYHVHFSLLKLLNHFGIERKFKGFLKDENFFLILQTNLQSNSRRSVWNLCFKGLNHKMVKTTQQFQITFKHFTWPFSYFTVNDIFVVYHPSLRKLNHTCLNGNMGRNCMRATLPERLE